MLAAERRSHITELVHTHGAVRVHELVETLGVSDMTVRRDLDALDVEGAVRKVHGGAVSVQPRPTDEPGFGTKSDQMRQEKSAIAAAAARLVQPGMSVVLSAGTTTWRLAHLLKDICHLTVITNSPRISDVFHAESRQDQTVILTGGIRTRSEALVGPTTVAALRPLHTDLAFIGAHGISAQAGLTTPNYLEAETNQALMAAARHSVILADHSKWGVVGVMTFAQLDDVETLITDDGLDQDAEHQLREAGVDLQRAPTRTDLMATPDQLATGQPPDGPGDSE